MIEIIICLIVWCWGLTPLWLNVLLTILLFLRFSWRVLLTLRKFLEFATNDSNIIQKEKENENTKTDIEV